MPSFYGGTVSGAAGGELGGTYPNPKLTVYRNIATCFARASAATLAISGTFTVPGGAGQINALTATGASNAFLYLNPTDYAATGYSTKLRIITSSLVNDTAPAATFTFGLYPVSAVVGGSGALTPTLGAVVSGSTAAVTTPAANSMNAIVSSGEFDFPTAGMYMLACAIAPTMATNSFVMFPLALQVRNV